MAEQLRGLRDDHGWDVTAVVSGAEGPLVDLLREEGIPFHVEPGFCFLDGMSSVLRIPALVWRLARYFRANRFDVVQSHLLFALLPTRFAAWLADTPVRLAMYPSPYHLDAPKTLWMDRFNLWMETRLIASCRYTYDRLEACGARSDRLALIYYGVDERRYDPVATTPSNLAGEFGWPASTPIIVKVAYFYARQPSGDWTPAVVRGKNTKAFEDLIEAMPMVLAEFPEAKLLLVGGPWGDAGEAYQAEMKQMVCRMNLSGSVVFTGFRNDVNGVLLGADVAVQAAIYENVGGVVESLLLARPTVATSVGGMVDCVIDGQTGALANPGDPADLARSINIMLADPARADRLGQAGRQLMLERCSLKKTCRDLDDLYRTARRETKRRPYNLMVTFLRSLVGVPVLAWFVACVTYRDFYCPAVWPTHRRRLQDVQAIPFLLDIYLVHLLARWTGRPPADNLPLIPPHIRWANRKVTIGHLARRYAIEIPLHCKVYRRRVVDGVIRPLNGFRIFVRRIGAWARRWC